MADADQGPRPAVRSRPVQALIDVLPRTVSVEIPTGDPRADVIIGGHSLNVKWVGEGSLGVVVSLLRAAERRPDVVAARELSPGAKNALSEVGVA